MKLVQTLVVRDEADAVDAQIAYHLNAGVDFVIAMAGEAADARETLESYERDGYVRVLREEGRDVRTRMARLAGTEYGADWVLNSEPGEFWWPRGESLKDVLAPIPPRYTIVQGLRRELVGRPDGDEPFGEQMTMRRSLQESPDGRALSPAAMLRPIHRADPNVVVHADGSLDLSRPVPLRAWYPIEVFHYAPNEELSAGAAVDDTRLRDALRTLREKATTRTFALPGSDGGVLTFRTPDVVDDAAYAVECAAVGEVDLPRLEEYVTELEQRIGWLEQRFWPRLLKSLSRRLPRRAP